MRLLTICRGLNAQNTHNTARSLRWTCRGLERKKNCCHPSDWWGRWDMRWWGVGVVVVVGGGSFVVPFQRDHKRRKIKSYLLTQRAASKLRGDNCDAPQIYCRSLFTIMTSSRHFEKTGRKKRRWSSLGSAGFKGPELRKIYFTYDL